MSDKIEEMLEELVDAVEEFVYARELGGSASEKERVNKARDAIRAELAEARKLAKAIPVNERMPAFFEDVMFFDAPEKTWTIGYLCGEKWTSIDLIIWRGDNFARVTHWMPLPPAPEVEP